MSSSSDRIPALIAELTDLVARVVAMQLGVAAERASEVGAEAARTFCREFKGELVYIPSGHLLDIDDRDREMYAWFCTSGRNYAATARRFELGLQWTYKRIKAIEESRYAKRQMPLPLDDNDDETEPA